jgi:hypothetical protein
MATVVDALVVTLGLDSSKFVRDQKAAEDSTRKFGETATKVNKQQLDETKKLADAFNKAKNELAGLVAIAIGFNGLKDFVSSMVTGNAALGRTSTLLGMSARDLDAWGRSVETVGGTAQGFQQSLQNIEGGLQKFRMGMGGDEIVTALARLGVQAKNGAVDLIDLSRALVRIKDAQGIQAALALGQQLGLDQGTFQMLIQGPAAVRALHDRMYELSGVNEENIKRAQELQKNWAIFKETMDGLAQEIFSDVAPALKTLLDLVEKGVTAFKEADQATNGWLGKVTALGIALTGVLGTLRLVAGLVGLAGGAGAAGAAAGAAEGAAGVAGVAGAGGLLAGAGLVGALLALVAGLGAFLEFMQSTTTGGHYVGKHTAPQGGPDESKDVSIWDRVKNAFTSAGPGHFVSRSDSNAHGSTSGTQYDANGNVIGGSGAGGSSGATGSGQSRGIRNNNPGNIEYGDFARRMGATGSDGRFAIFPTMQAGVAAMLALIKGYKQKGIDTISGIISKYAPPGENNDAAYIADVVKQTGIGANQHLTDSQYASVQQAMARHESGYRGMVGAGVNAQAQQSGGGTSTVQTNIQSINVQTQATDANGIARDMHKALSNNSLISSGTYGVA